MGNALAMLDWPSAGQLVVSAGCGLAVYVLSRREVAQFISSEMARGAAAEVAAEAAEQAGLSETAGGGGVSVAGAVMTSAGVAAGLVVLDALCGRFVRRPYQDVHHGLVALTGCDSGLGFSLARHSLRMGLCVAAGCLDPNGEGARRLRVAAGRSGRLTVIPLDVTKQKSVNAFVVEVTRLLESNPSLRLLALVNNAGVMVFGEFDWQTEDQVERQVEVNLLGTMRVTKAFCPLLRSNRSRLVVVSSHCALEALPGLAPYGASKAALEAWSNALRVEQSKYGVRVITLVPGSFSTRSNIMARHEQNARDMEQDMRLRRPQDWDFHKDYFQVFHSYLKVISGEKGIQELHDAQLYFKYECCLLALLPKQQYIHAPMRYNIYHTLMRMTPRWLRDEVVKSFMQLPAYKGLTLTLSDSERSPDSPLEATEAAGAAAAARAMAAVAARAAARVVSKVSTGEEPGTSGMSRSHNHRMLEASGETSGDFSSSDSTSPPSGTCAHHRRQLSRSRAATGSAPGSPTRIFSPMHVLNPASPSLPAVARSSTAPPPPPPPGSSTPTVTPPSTSSASTPTPSASPAPRTPLRLTLKASGASGTRSATVQQVPEGESWPVSPSSQTIHRSVQGAGSAMTQISTRTCERCDKIFSPTSNLIRTVSPERATLDSTTVVQSQQHVHAPVSSVCSHHPAPAPAPPSPAPAPPSPTRRLCPMHQQLHQQRLLEEEAAAEKKEPTPAEVAAAAALARAEKAKKMQEQQQEQKQPPAESEEQKAPQPMGAAVHPTAPSRARSESAGGRPVGLASAKALEYATSHASSDPGVSKDGDIKSATSKTPGMTAPTVISPEIRRVIPSSIASVIPEGSLKASATVPVPALPESEAEVSPPPSPSPPPPECSVASSVTSTHPVKMPAPLACYSSPARRGSSPPSKSHVTIAPSSLQLQPLATATKTQPPDDDAAAPPITSVSRVTTAKSETAQSFSAARATSSASASRKDSVMTERGSRSVKVMPDDDPPMMKVPPQTVTVATAGEMVHFSSDEDEESWESDDESDTLFLQTAVRATPGQVHTASAVAAFARQALVIEDLMTGGRKKMSEWKRMNTSSSSSTEALTEAAVGAGAHRRREGQDGDRLGHLLHELLTRSGAAGRANHLRQLAKQLAKELAGSLRDAVRFDNPRCRAIADPRQEIRSVLREALVAHRGPSEGGTGRGAQHHLAMRLARRIVAAADAPDACTTTSYSGGAATTSAATDSAASSAPASTSRPSTSTAAAAAAAAAARAEDLTAALAVASTVTAKGPIPEEPEDAAKAATEKKVPEGVGGATSEEEPLSTTHTEGTSVSIGDTSASSGVGAHQGVWPGETPVAIEAARFARELLERETSRIRKEKQRRFVREGKLQQQQQQQQQQPSCVAAAAPATVVTCLSAMTPSAPVTALQIGCPAAASAACQSQPPPPPGPPPPSPPAAGADADTSAEAQWVCDFLRGALADAGQKGSCENVATLAEEMATAVVTAADVVPKGAVTQVLSETLRRRFLPVSPATVARMAADVAKRVRRAVQSEYNCPAAQPAPAPKPLPPWDTVQPESSRKESRRPNPVGAAFRKCDHCDQSAASASASTAAAKSKSVEATKSKPESGSESIAKTATEKSIREQSSERCKTPSCMSRKADATLNTTRPPHKPPIQGDPPPGGPLGGCGMKTCQAYRPKTPAAAKDPTPSRPASPRPPIERRAVFNARQDSPNKAAKRPESPAKDTLKRAETPEEKKAKKKLENRSSEEKQRRARASDVAPSTSNHHRPPSPTTKWKGSDPAEKQQKYQEAAKTPQSPNRPASPKVVMRTRSQRLTPKSSDQGALTKRGTPGTPERGKRAKSLASSDKQPQKAASPVGRSQEATEAEAVASKTKSQEEVVVKRQHPVNARLELVKRQDSTTDAAAAAKQQQQQQRLTLKLANRYQSSSDASIKKEKAPKQLPYPIVVEAKFTCTPIGATPTGRTEEDGGGGGGGAAATTTTTSGGFVTQVLVSARDGSEVTGARVKTESTSPSRVVDGGVDSSAKVCKKRRKLLRNDKLSDFEGGKRESRDRSAKKKRKKAKSRSRERSSEGRKSCSSTAQQLQVPSIHVLHKCDKSETVSTVVIPASETNVQEAHEEEAQEANSVKEANSRRSAPETLEGDRTTDRDSSLLATDDRGQRSRLSLNQIAGGTSAKTLNPEAGTTTLSETAPVTSDVVDSPSLSSSPAAVLKDLYHQKKRGPSDVGSPCALALFGGVGSKPVVHGAAKASPSSMKQLLSDGGGGAGEGGVGGGADESGADSSLSSQDESKTGTAAAAARKEIPDGVFQHRVITTAMPVTAQYWNNDQPPPGVVPAAEAPGTVDPQPPAATQMGDRAKAADDVTAKSGAAESSLPVIVSLPTSAEEAERPIVMQPPAFEKQEEDADTVAPLKEKASGSSRLTYTQSKTSAQLADPSLKRGEAETAGDVSEKQEGKEEKSRDWSRIGTGAEEDGTTSVSTEAPQEERKEETTDTEPAKGEESVRAIKDGRVKIEKTGEADRKETKEGEDVEMKMEDTERKEMKQSDAEKVEESGTKQEVGETKVKTETNLKEQSIASTSSPPPPAPPAPNAAPGASSGGPCCNQKTCFMLTAICNPPPSSVPQTGGEDSSTGGGGGGGTLCLTVGRARPAAVNQAEAGEDKGVATSQQATEKTRAEPDTAATVAVAAPAAAPAAEDTTTSTTTTTREGYYTTQEKTNEGVRTRYLEDDESTVRSLSPLPHSEEVDLQGTDEGAVCAPAPPQQKEAKQTKRGRSKSASPEKEGSRSKSPIVVSKGRRPPSPRISPPRKFFLSPMTSSRPGSPERKEARESKARGRSSRRASPSPRAATQEADEEIPLRYMPSKNAQDVQEEQVSPIATRTMLFGSSVMSALMQPSSSASSSSPPTVQVYAKREDTVITIEDTDEEDGDFAQQRRSLPATRPPSAIPKRLASEEMVPPHCSTSGSLVLVLKSHESGKTTTTAADGETTAATEPVARMKGGTAAAMTSASDRTDDDDDQDDSGAAEYEDDDEEDVSCDTISEEETAVTARTDLTPLSDSTISENDHFPGSSTDITSATSLTSFMSACSELSRPPSWKSSMPPSTSASLQAILRGAHEDLRTGGDEAAESQSSWRMIEEDGEDGATSRDNLDGVCSKSHEDVNVSAALRDPPSGDDQTATETSPLPPETLAPAQEKTRIWSRFGVSETSWWVPWRSKGEVRRRPEVPRKEVESSQCKRNFRSTTTSDADSRQCNMVEAPRQNLHKEDLQQQQQQWESSLANIFQPLRKFVAERAENVTASTGSKLFGRLILPWETSCRSFLQQENKDEEQLDVERNLKGKRSTSETKGDAMNSTSRRRMECSTSGEESSDNSMTVCLLQNENIERNGRRSSREGVGKDDEEDEECDGETTGIKNDCDAPRITAARKKKNVCKVKKSIMKKGRDKITRDVRSRFLDSYTIETSSRGIISAESTENILRVMRPVSSPPKISILEYMSKSRGFSKGHTRISPRDPGYRDRLILPLSHFTRTATTSQNNCQRRSSQSARNASRRFGRIRTPHCCNHICTQDNESYDVLDSSGNTRNTTHDHGRHLHHGPRYTLDCGSTEMTDSNQQMIWTSQEDAPHIQVETRAQFLTRAEGETKKRLHESKDETLSEMLQQSEETLEEPIDWLKERVDRLLARVTKLHKPSEVLREKVENLQEKIEFTDIKAPVRGKVVVDGKKSASQLEEQVGNFIERLKGLKKPSLSLQQRIQLVKERIYQEVNVLPQEQEDTLQLLPYKIETRVQHLSVRISGFLKKAEVLEKRMKRICTKPKKVKKFLNISSGAFATMEEYINAQGKTKEEPKTKEVSQELLYDEQIVTEGDLSDDSSNWLDMSDDPSQQNWQSEDNVDICGQQDTEVRSTGTSNDIMETLAVCPRVSKFFTDTSQIFSESLFSNPDASNADVHTETLTVPGVSTRSSPSVPQTSHDIEKALPIHPWTESLFPERSKSSPESLRLICESPRDVSEAMQTASEPLQVDSETLQATSEPFQPISEPVNVNSEPLHTMSGEAISDPVQAMSELLPIPSETSQLFSSSSYPVLETLEVCRENRCLPTSQVAPRPVQEDLVTVPRMRQDLPEMLKDLPEMTQNIPSMQQRLPEMIQDLPEMLKDIPKDLDERGEKVEKERLLESVKCLEATANHLSQLELTLLERRSLRLLEKEETKATEQRLEETLLRLREHRSKALWTIAHLREEQQSVQREMNVLVVGVTPEERDWLQRHKELMLQQEEALRRQIERLQEHIREVNLRQERIEEQEETIRKVLGLTQRDQDVPLLTHYPAVKEEENEVEEEVVEEKKKKNKVVSSLESKKHQEDDEEEVIIKTYEPILERKASKRSETRRGRRREAKVGKRTENNSRREVKTRGLHIFRRLLGFSRSSDSSLLGRDRQDERPSRPSSSQSSRCPLGSLRTSDFVNNNISTATFPVVGVDSQTERIILTAPFERIGPREGRPILMPRCPEPTLRVSSAPASLVRKRLRPKLQDLMQMDNVWIDRNVPCTPHSPLAFVVSAYRTQVVSAEKANRHRGGGGGAGLEEDNEPAAKKKKKETAAVAAEESRMKSSDETEAAATKTESKEKKQKNKKKTKEETKHDESHHSSVESKREPPHEPIDSRTRSNSRNTAKSLKEEADKGQRAKIGSQKPRLLINKLSSSAVLSASSSSSAASHPPELKSVSTQYSPVASEGSIPLESSEMTTSSEQDDALPRPAAAAHNRTSGASEEAPERRPDPLGPLEPVPAPMPADQWKASARAERNWVHTTLRQAVNSTSPTTQSSSEDRFLVDRQTSTSRSNVKTPLPPSPPPPLQPKRRSPPINIPRPIPSPMETSVKTALDRRPTITSDGTRFISKPRSSFWMVAGSDTGNSASTSEDGQPLSTTPLQGRRSNAPSITTAPTPFPTSSSLSSSLSSGYNLVPSNSSYQWEALSIGRRSRETEEAARSSSMTQDDASKPQRRRSSIPRPSLMQRTSTAPQATALTSYRFTSVEALLENSEEGRRNRRLSNAPRPHSREMKSYVSRPLARLSEDEKFLIEEIPSRANRHSRQSPSFTRARSTDYPEIHFRGRRTESTPETRMKRDTSQAVLPRPLPLLIENEMKVIEGIARSPDELASTSEEESKLNSFAGSSLKLIRETPSSLLSVPSTRDSHRRFLTTESVLRQTESTAESEQSSGDSMATAPSTPESSRSLIHPTAIRRPTAHVFGAQKDPLLLSYNSRQCISEDSRSHIRREDGFSSQKESLLQPQRVAEDPGRGKDSPDAVESSPSSPSSSFIRADATRFVTAFVTARRTGARLGTERGPSMFPLFKTPKSPSKDNSLPIQRKTDEVERKNVGVFGFRCTSANRPDTPRPMSQIRMQKQLQGAEETLSLASPTSPPPPLRRRPYAPVARAAEGGMSCSSLSLVPPSTTSSRSASYSSSQRSSTSGSGSSDSVEEEEEKETEKEQGSDGEEEEDRERQEETDEEETLTDGDDNEEEEDDDKSCATPDLIRGREHRPGGKCGKEECNRQPKPCPTQCVTTRRTGKDGVTKNTTTSCRGACDAAVQSAEREVWVHEPLSKSHARVPTQRLADIASVECGLCSSPSATRSASGPVQSQHHAQVTAAGVSTSQQRRPPEPSVDEECCEGGGLGPSEVEAARARCTCDVAAERRRRRPPPPPPPPRNDSAAEMPDTTGQPPPSGRDAGTGLPLPPSTATAAPPHPSSMDQSRNQSDTSSTQRMTADSAPSDSTSSASPTQDDYRGAPSRQSDSPKRAPSSSNAAAVPRAIYETRVAQGFVLLNEKSEYGGGASRDAKSQAPLSSDKTTTDLLRASLSHSKSSTSRHSTTTVSNCLAKCGGRSGASLPPQKQNKKKSEEEEKVESTSSKKESSDAAAAPKATRKVKRKGSRERSGLRGERKKSHLASKAHHASRRASQSPRRHQRATTTEPQDSDTLASEVDKAQIEQRSKTRRTVAAADAAQQSYDEMKQAHDAKMKDILNRIAVTTNQSRKQLQQTPTTTTTKKQQKTADQEDRQHRRGTRLRQKKSDQEQRDPQQQQQQSTRHKSRDSYKEKLTDMVDKINSSLTEAEKLSKHLRHESRSFCRSSKDYLHQHSKKTSKDLEKKGSDTQGKTVRKRESREEEEVEDRVAIRLKSDDESLDLRRRVSRTRETSSEKHMRRRDASPPLSRDKTTAPSLKKKAAAEADPGSTPVIVMHLQDGITSNDSSENPTPDPSRSLTPRSPYYASPLHSRSHSRPESGNRGGGGGRQSTHHDSRFKVWEQDGGGRGPTRSDLYAKLHRSLGQGSLRATEDAQQRLLHHAIREQDAEPEDAGGLQEESDPGSSSRYSQYHDSKRHRRHERRAPRGASTDFASKARYRESRRRMTSDVTLGFPGSNKLSDELSDLPDPVICRSDKYLYHLQNPHSTSGILHVEESTPPPQPPPPSTRRRHSKETPARLKASKSYVKSAGVPSSATNTEITMTKIQNPGVTGPEVIVVNIKSTPSVQGHKILPEREGSGYAKQQRADEVQSVQAAKRQSTVNMSDKSSGTIKDLFSAVTVMLQRAMVQTQEVVFNSAAVAEKRPEGEAVANQQQQQQQGQPQKGSEVSLSPCVTPPHPQSSQSARSKSWHCNCPINPVTKSDQCVCLETDEDARSGSNDAPSCMTKCLTSSTSKQAVTFDRARSPSTNDTDSSLPPLPVAALKPLTPSLSYPGGEKEKKEEEEAKGQGMRTSEQETKHHEESLKSCRCESWSLQSSVKSSSPERKEGGVTGAQLVPMAPCMRAVTAAAAKGKEEEEEDMTCMFASRAHVCGAGLPTNAAPRGEITLYAGPCRRSAAGPPALTVALMDTTATATAAVNAAAAATATPALTLGKLVSDAGSAHASYSLVKPPVEKKPSVMDFKSEKDQGVCSCEAEDILEGERCLLTVTDADGHDGAVHSALAACKCTDPKLCEKAVTVAAALTHEVPHARTEEQTTVTNLADAYGKHLLEDCPPKITCGPQADATSRSADEWDIPSPILLKVKRELENGETTGAATATAVVEEVTDATDRPVGNFKSFELLALPSPLMSTEPTVEEETEETKVGCTAATGEADKGETAVPTEKAAATLVEDVKHDEPLGKHLPRCPATCPKQADKGTTVSAILHAAKAHTKTEGTDPKPPIRAKAAPCGKCKVSDKKKTHKKTSEGLVDKDKTMSAKDPVQTDTTTTSTSADTSQEPSGCSSPCGRSKAPDEEDVELRTPTSEASDEHPDHHLATKAICDFEQFEALVKNVGQQSEGSDPNQLPVAIATNSIEIKVEAEKTEVMEPSASAQEEAADTYHEMEHDSQLPPRSPFKDAECLDLGIIQTTAQTLSFQVAVEHPCAPFTKTMADVSEKAESDVFQTPMESKTPEVEERPGESDAEHRPSTDAQEDL